MLLRAAAVGRLLAGCSEKAGRSTKQQHQQLQPTFAARAKGRIHDDRVRPQPRLLPHLPHVAAHKVNLRGRRWGVVRGDWALSLSATGAGSPPTKRLAHTSSILSVPGASLLPIPSTAHRQAVLELAHILLRRPQSVVVNVHAHHVRRAQDGGADAQHGLQGCRGSEREAGRGASAGEAASSNSQQRRQRDQGSSSSGASVRTHRAAAEVDHRLPVKLVKAVGHLLWRTNVGQ